MAKIRSIETLTIDSTVLCCNLVNTVSSWKTKKRYDYLVNYDAFVDWCAKLAISKPERLDMLRQLAVARSGEAIVVLDRIKEIREVLHGLISAVARDNNDEKELFLPATNLLLADASSRQRLIYFEDKFLMDQVDAPGDLMAPVWKAVHSLVGLLTEHDETRIKECPKCGWVFLDETKNGSRKWCNPTYCGTSDKMMRYNKRKNSRLMEKIDENDIS